MLTVLFYIAMFLVFGKLFLFGIKMAWGITKLLFTIVFLPVILIGMIVGGLISLAWPLLIIIAIISFIVTAA